MTEHLTTNYSRWRASNDRPSDEGRCFNTQEFEKKIELAQSHVRKILGRNIETKCADAYDDKWVQYHMPDYLYDSCKYVSLELKGLNFRAST